MNKRMKQDISGSAVEITEAPGRERLEQWDGVRVGIVSI